MAITSPTFDPATTAQALAEKYTAPRQQILDSQASLASATEKALSDLNSAMLSFQSSLSSLTGSNKALYAHAATFSDTTLGSATANSTAVAGTYSFFVQQLATASQYSYAFASPSSLTGTINILKNGGDIGFSIDATNMSVRDLAAAINSSPKNTSLVTASVITTTSGTELVLTSKATGEANGFTLAPGAATETKLIGAQDAMVYVGSKTGTLIKQASNTITAIDGVSMTFKKAQAADATPLTVTVGPDSSATTSNVQAFVDAYNKLKNVLNRLTSIGNPSAGVEGGAFAHDSGVRALKDRLNSLLRPAGGDSLAAYGIVSNKDGTLELRSSRLLSQMALKPTGLDALLGAVSDTTPTGIAGALDKYLDTWSSSTGQISQRKNATSKLQASFSDRQAALDRQFDSAYKRYLGQFSQLEALQGAMNSNSSLFDALFSKSND